jgi:cobaltochelatase CobT
MTKNPNTTLEARLTAATKALSGSTEIHFVHSANQMADGLERTTTILLPPIPEPGPGKLMPEAELAELRGEADLAALLLRHHRAQPHQKLRPANAITAALFDQMEQVRIEAIATQTMDGTRANLQARLYKQLDNRPDLAATHTLELSDAAPLLLRAMLANIPPPATLEPKLKNWQSALHPILAQYQSRLQEALPTQAQFARLTHQLLREMSHFDPSLKDVTLADGDAMGESEAVAAETSEGDAEEESDHEALQMPEGFGEEGGDQSDSGDDDAEPMAESTVEGHGDETEEQRRRKLADALPDLPNMPNIEVRDPDAGYSIYTKEYDEVTPAERLASQEELIRLRKVLDMRLEPMAGVAHKLAARLQRLLLAQQQRYWEIEQEEGELNAAQLSRLITDPNYETPYKRERVSDMRDTVIGLLIDNSGSMRGRPITLAAMSADILAQSLERCGVKSEILGFTTREWKGGESRKQWLKDGQPSHPGRLNDLRHIIYKSADQRASRGRRNLALMLKDGILKENIDGEALQWAHDRLMARPESRRILMVISDGAPVDDATLSTNDVGYLDSHLRHVIARIENKSPIEMLAIGIGHDVTRYYKQAITLSDPDQLGETLIAEVLALFGAKDRRKAA